MVTGQVLLLQFPFVLTLVAGGLAGASAVLLRRAAAALGRSFAILSTALDVAAAGAFAFSFGWAWSMSHPSRATGFALFVVLGVICFLGGMGLAIQALSVRGAGAIRSWPPSRFENRTPYRQLRRPIAAGVMLMALGAALLVDTIVLWVCFGLWLVILHLVLELREWEMKQRFPECRDYLQRTPRYLPRLWGTRSRSGD